MAIEPLGSIMSVQAQSISTPKPVVSAKAPSVESQSSTAQEAAQVDNTVNVVAEGQSKGNAGGNSSEQQQQQPTNEQIKRAVEQLNKNMMAHSEAVFGMHEETNRVTIKIVDKDTKEVLKEFPPEKTLDMIAKVWEMAGILVDERR